MTDRIALFVPTMNIGGAEKVTVKVANELSNRGHDIDVLLAQREGDFLDDLNNDVDVVDIGSTVTYPWPETYVGPNLRSYIDDREPDAILASLALSNVVAAVATKLSHHSPRLVLGVHAPPSKQQGLKYRLSYTVGRRGYEMADRIVAVSEGVKKDVSRTLGIAEETIDVIYNPIVDDELSRASERDVDHDWFEEDVPVVLNVASIQPVKGQRTLIEAFDTVLDSRDARLVVIGDGSHRDTLVELVDDLGIASKVDFLGERNNPYRYMASASVFVLASRFEGLGNVLVEALACGCPVVSTSCPYGPEEILEHGEYGRLVPVDDPPSLAEAIETTLDEDMDPSDLEARASDFRVSEIVDQYEDVLTE